MYNLVEEPTIKHRTLADLAIYMVDTQQQRKPAVWYARAYDVSRDLSTLELTTLRNTITALEVKEFGEAITYPMDPVRKHYLKTLNAYWEAVDADRDSNTEETQATLTAAGKALLAASTVLKGREIELGVRIQHDL